MPNRAGSANASLFMLGLRTWRFPAGLAALVVTGAPLSVAAQNAVSDAAPGARVQDVTFSVETLYDSNVAATDVVNGLRSGIRRSDVIFQPAISFNLSRPIGRETVYLEGSAGYDFYTRNSVLNRENINIAPGVLAQVGRCQTSINGDYSRAQSDLAELALTPGGTPTVLEEKNVLQVEQIAGSADCGKTSGLAPNARVSETWTQNSSPTQRYTDAQTFSGSAGLAYRRPTFGSISLFGAYSETYFPNRAALALFFGIPLSTGYQTYSGGVTYTRAIGSRLQGSVSLSYTKLTNEGGSSPGFSGPTYSAALVYQVSSRLSAQAQISRATLPSVRLNSTFALDNSYSGGVTYRLTSRLVLDGGASLVHDKYNGIPYPVGFDLTNETNYTVFANADYQLTRRISLGLRAEHIQRDANYPGLTYPETRVGLTARLKF